MASTDDQVIASIIDMLEELPLADVSDQLTTILAKFQVPPEKQVNMLMRTTREIKTRGAQVKDSNKDLHTKSVKLVSVVSDFVSRAKHGNSAAAGATKSRRKAANNAKTNMTSYFEEYVPAHEDEKEATPVVWSDSELTEIKSEVVKKEDTEEDAEEAFLEELLDDEEEVQEEFIKEEVIKEEEIKTEPYKEEEVMAAVTTRPKRGRSTAARPETKRTGRSSRTRAPEVVCIDSSSDESAPVPPVAALTPAKKRGAPAKAAPAKRARAAKKAKPAPPPPAEVEEEEAEPIPEAYVKYEEVDEEMPELDNAKPQRVTKEKPVANVRPTQRQQKKVKPTVTEYESDDEEMGDNVIVNFTKENTPTFENSYSHIVLADKPDPGLYPDNATPPTVTEVLALESCKIVQKPDMSLFELLQLVHSPEGQYLVVTMVDEAKLKQKNYHLLIPGVINDVKDKLAES